jgi:hyperosmotically inducible periplasmic protein
MKTPQLLVTTLALAAALACNRSDQNPNAQRTAEQVRAAATKAGHQLADSWLTTKIQAQYFADDDVKARHINVSTRDGVVTLTGFVDGQPQRELAVQIARTTDGVVRVNDQLAIAASGQDRKAVATSGTGPTVPDSATAAGIAANTPNPPTPPDDAQITARVQSKFFVDDRVKARRINVETRGGVVTLTGEVADENERAQALLLARSAEGVSRVEDHLTVVPPPATSATPSTTTPATTPVDDARLATTIQARYFVDPTVKASTIDVAARNGVVTLQGAVGSDAVRKQALAIAQNTEGVVQVVDRLTIPAATR